MWPPLLVHLEPDKIVFWDLQLEHKYYSHWLGKFSISQLHLPQIYWTLMETFWEFQFKQWGSNWRNQFGNLGCQSVVREGKEGWHGTIPSRIEGWLLSFLIGINMFLWITRQKVREDKIVFSILLVDGWRIGSPQIVLSSKTFYHL